MKTMTQKQLESALISGTEIKTPVQIKTSQASQTKYGRVTVLSYILDYDQYVESMVMRDVCYLHRGRLNLLSAMVTPAENLDSAITKEISRKERYYNRSIAVA